MQKKKTVETDNLSANVEKCRSNIQKYLLECSSNVSQTDYFQKRGLSEDTIRKFNLGYDSKKKLVIIPYNSELTYYQCRSIKDKQYYKPRLDIAGQEPIFNAERIQPNDEDPLFVVESPICAMSIEQCGKRAVATCGTSGWKKVAEALISVKYKGKVILAMDNDEAGMKASNSLVTALKTADIKVVECVVAEEYKDPNELLIADRERLKTNLENATLETEEQGLREDTTNLELSTKVEEPVELSVLVKRPKSSHILLRICFVDTSDMTPSGYQNIEEVVGVRYNGATKKWEIEESKNGLIDDSLWKEYIASPYIKTIKVLLDKSPTKTWMGSVSEIIEQVKEILGITVDDYVNVVGRKITSYEPYLKLDGISHKMGNTIQRRKHIFAKK